MPDDGAPEAVLSFVALVPDALQLVKVVLDQGKQLRGARIAGPVDSLSRTLHIRSNRCTDSVAKNMLVTDGQKDWANAEVVARSLCSIHEGPERKVSRPMSVEMFGRQ